MYMRLGYRRASLGLAALMLLLTVLAGCGSSNTTSTTGDKAKDQTLKLTWNSGGGGQDIPTYDPRESYDSASQPVVNLLFDPLVTLDKNLNIEPWAAKSWTISPDGTTYTFNLQPNQKFADGTPLTASGYAWTYDSEFNPCGGWFKDGTATLMLDVVNNSGIVGSHAYSAEKCANGQAQGAITTLIGSSIIPDDSANTLTIKLTKPAGYFLDSMTLPFSMAVEKSCVATLPDLGYDGTWRDKLLGSGTGACSSGMFYASTLDHKGKIYLKQNPYWWGNSAGKKPNFTEIDFNLFDSSDTLYQTYQSDQSYAFDDGIPAAQIAAAKGNSDYHEQPAASIETVGMNWNIAPFNNADARKAFCLALNRDALNTSIFKGTTKPSWNLYPPGLPGYDASLQGLDGAPTSGDVAKAQQHWAAYKATLNGAAVPAITLHFNVSSSTQKLLAEAYQSTWQQAFPDAHITISTSPWKQQVKTLFAGTMQLGRDGWLMDYPDPQDFLSVLFHSGVGNNYFNSSVPAADTLLDQADTMTGASNQQQRYSLYNQAEQLLVNNVAVCPVFTGMQHYRIRTWVKGGWDFSAAATWPQDSWVTGYIANH
jgi:oligopeptide transport system substrate-binding protein